MKVINARLQRESNLLHVDPIYKLMKVYVFVGTKELYAFKLDCNSGKQFTVFVILLCTNCVNHILYCNKL